LIDIELASNCMMTANQALSLAKIRSDENWVEKQSEIDIFSAFGLVHLSEINSKRENELLIF